MESGVCIHLWEGVALWEACLTHNWSVVSSNPSKAPIVSLSKKL